ncbi:Sulfatase-modifying factor enzyme 1 [Flavobacterium caeni]|uniref:Sulfatase-modifying factor enzyme 1 n=2 Tax=Flavobacterium caeni TaxID=490189 RepID=A0A1G5GWT2_9FLAO|nr:Sulfatase-modifying factor enzyme 1 [Flavobacterium caeni]
MKTIKLFAMWTLFGSLTIGHANNIAITGISSGTQNTANHTLPVNLSISWENSWRTLTNERNYDGAWIIIKYKKGGSDIWRHCTLKTSGFTAAAGSEIKVAPNPTDNTRGKGAFLYRAENNTGIGNVAFNNNQFIWDYGIDGVADSDTVELKAFALEMVYIPAGEYWLGSGGQESKCFTGVGSTNGAYLVTGDHPIVIGNADGNLNLNGGGTGTSIPDTFPNGFNAFWIMKYECSQQQYADFLNNIEATQAANMNASTSANFAGTSHPNFQPMVPDRANNNLNYGEFASFADWSCLRPMSEMEFEKACRGVIEPFPNEFAWGTTAYTQLTAINNIGQPIESVATEGANCHIKSTNGNFPLSLPTRVGIFARPSGSTRALSGATYYGVMNMSDNLLEFTVFAGTPEGRVITDTVHGDGALTASGNTDISAWISPEALGVRGARFNGGAGELERGRISDRYYANTPTIGSGHVSRGIRLVRTAP